MHVLITTTVNLTTISEETLGAKSNAIFKLRYCAGSRSRLWWRWQGDKSTCFPINLEGSSLFQVLNPCRTESMLAKLGECIATRQAAGLWSDQVDYASCGVFFQRLYLLYHVIDSCVQYFCRNSFRVENAMVIRPLKFWSPKIRHPKQPIQRPAHCFRALG